MPPPILLHSKITVPHAALESIERERLFDLLRHTGAKKITILRAPAGYGKTTLLSQWFSQLNESVAWLSIDTTDNDPIRFWKYIIGAVSDAVKSDIDFRLLSLLDEQSSLELLIDSFLNEIGSIEKTIHMVFDDYHLIEGQAIHATMARFIEYLPNNVCVYITSRIDLPFPLAKWRVKAWLTEIGVDQLRFTYNEIENFYRKQELGYDNAEILQQVFEKTEGWAAGIQLAGLMSLKTEWNVESFESTHPFITEFLLQEILSSLSSETQDFLVQTSILNELKPTICDALTNRTDSHSILMELEKKGLFIVRLHTSEPVFRYHHLFADALQIELKQRYSQASMSSLYEKAAAFLCEQKDIISAIELLMQGKQYKVADEWIYEYLVYIFTSKQTSTFTRWVQLLRASSCPVHVETLVMYIITLANSLKMNEAKELIVELERKHMQEQWMDKVEFQGIAHILETVKAYVLFAIGEDLDQIAEIIKKQLAEGLVSTRWDKFPIQYNLSEARILRTGIGSRGKLWSFEKSESFIELFRGTELKESSMTVFSYGVSAESLYERSLMDFCIFELEKALKSGLEWKDPGLFIPMYILKARIYGTQKQFIEAQAILDYGMKMTKEKHWIRSLHAMKAHCYVMEEDIIRAEQELNLSMVLNSPDAESDEVFWLLVQARLFIAKGEIEKALKSILQVKVQAIEEEQMSTIIETTVLEAVCHDKLSNEELAITTLHQALEHGVKYLYVRTFTDEADVMKLLKKYVRIRRSEGQEHFDSLSMPYVEHLAGPVEEDPVLDLITRREREVLQLLASGSSNMDIASKLVLSEGTIRIYLSNIYSKLGVNSRTQAVIRAKELNI